MRAWALVWQEMRVGALVWQEMRVGALVWQEIRAGVRGIFFQCADFRLIAVKNRISFWLPVVMTLQMLRMPVQGV